MSAINTEPFIRFISERETIRVRRAAGEPPPWTENRILQEWSFCNVRREDDRVTRWIAEHWREPHADDPDLWFAMTVARFVNWPDTLEALGYPVPWNREHFVNILQALAASGAKVFGPAYTISNGGQSIPKVEHVANVFDGLWQGHARLRPRPDERLAEYHGRLKQRKGLADFMAAQIIADLKYVEPLKSANDWFTFAAPGPGSERGMSRVLGRPVHSPWDADNWRAALRKLHDAIRPELERIGLGDLHASDLQSCLCEFDKFERVRLGEGKPKRRFTPHHDNREASNKIRNKASRSTNAPNSAALDFLAKLRPGGPWVLTAIVPDGQTTTITARTADEVEAFIRKHDGKSNLYYSVNPTRRAMSKKAKKADIAAIEYLLADLDPNDGESAEAAKARYLAQLEGSFEPKPTAVVDSGNGIQGLWKLQERIVLGEPVNGKFSPENQAKIDDVEARTAAVMLRLGSKAGTQNIDRILRLPGTTNLPNKKKRDAGRVACPTRLISFNGAAYPLTAFSPKPEADKQSGRQNERAAVDVDALPVSDRIKNLIRGINDPDHPYPTRSEQVMAVLVAMAGGGCTDEQMTAVMLDKALPIGQHVREQPRVGTYLEKQIEHARDQARASGFQAKSSNQANDWKLVAVRMSDIEAKKIVWVWKYRIARGKLTTFAGLPDTNKSTAALYLAALVTVGGNLPAGEGQAPVGNVIILSAEDDAADTIRPRLEVMGANLDRIQIVTMVKEERGKGRRGFDLTQDIERLEMLVRETGDVVLIIIDPMSAYMGKPGKLDSYRPTDVRAVLSPLADMAARCEVAVMGIEHLNKTAGLKALLRVAGSVSFVAAPRSLVIFVRDEEDQDRRLFLPAKNNNAPEEFKKGLAFRIVKRLAPPPVCEVMPAIEWEDEPVSTTADEALAADTKRTDGRRSETAEICKRFLQEMLRSGPRMWTEIEEEARKRGINPGSKSIRTAREALDVRSIKKGTGGWEWYLPGQAQGGLPLDDSAPF